MPILKRYKLISKTIIVFQILFFSLITSCTLKKNDTFFLNEEHDNQLKKLIIPKGINMPEENQEYKIPYTQKDLNKKNYDIFPPV